jgi:hypothetical protein
LHLSIVALETADNINTWILLDIHKNWEFAGLFNYHIIKIIESGVIYIINRKWIKSSTNQYGIARDGLHYILQILTKSC